MKGLFDLNSADDLCRKLEADYHRVSENPGDRFAAFDFVVTAWHLLEWRLPGKQKQAERDAICSRNPVLRICEHLAVGAKHFEPTNPKLQSVQDTHGDGPWESSAWAPGVWASGVWQEILTVHLDGPAQAEFGERMTFGPPLWKGIVVPGNWIEVGRLDWFLRAWPYGA